MGAIATIIVLIVFLFIGLMEIAAGIAGLVISVKKARSGITAAKVFTAISAVALAIGILFAAIPSGFFAFVVITNATPPDDFVETDIVIEEDGYQDTRFTADGVVYETLDLWLCDSTPIGEPVFTYKEAGFMNRSQWGNYYTVDNDHGFRLVSDSLGLLFCPVENKANAIEYYTDLQNASAYYCGYDDTKVKLSDEECKTVQNFLTVGTDDLEQRELILDEVEEFYIDVTSKDGAVLINSYSFLLFDGKIYYAINYTFDFEDGLTYCTVGVLAEEISDGFFKIHEIYKQKGA